MRIITPIGIMVICIQQPRTLVSVLNRLGTEVVHSYPFYDTMVLDGITYNVYRSSSPAGGGGGAELRLVIE